MTGGLKASEVFTVDCGEQGSRGAYSWGRCCLGEEAQGKDGQQRGPSGPGSPRGAGAVIQVQNGKLCRVDKEERKRLIEDAKLETNLL